jgi:hypothetical protein
MACSWLSDLSVLITACSRLLDCGVVLAGVQAKPWRVAYGQP